jgi:hypothetical protein
MTYTLAYLQWFLIKQMIRYYLKVLSIGKECMYVYKRKRSKGRINPRPSYTHKKYIGKTKP